MTTALAPATGCIPGTPIFIIAHAPLASAFRQCVLHVYEEEQPQTQQPRYCAGIAALDVQPDASPEDTLLHASAALAQLQLQTGNASQPTLILTDIFGATPCNIAQKLASGSRARAKVVAGVNLPMLLRSVCYRHEALDALVARAIAGGGQGVMQVAVAVPQNQNRKSTSDDQIHHQNQQ